MKKVIQFLKNFLKKVNANELFLISNALTYKLVLAVIPFVIFLLSLIAFFDIEMGSYIKDLNIILPTPLYQILNTVLTEVLETKRIELVSTSFIAAIYSISSGFNSVIIGLNKIYGKPKKNFFKRRLISIIFVFIFAILTNFILLFFVFVDYIKYLFLEYTKFNLYHFWDSLFLYILIIIALLIITLIIYKIAIFKKLKIKNIAPGALFTVTFWLILSKLFNIYINNYSKYSKVYGSIGSVFVLIIWLNMISLIFLLGAQLNAMLEKHFYISIEK